MSAENAHDYFTRCIEFEHPELLINNKQSENDDTEKRLIIHQKFTSDESGVVWDAAIMAAKYFEKQQYDGKMKLENMNIVELGTGTGFVGLWLAAFGARVAITDLPTHLELAKMNLDANKQSLPTLSERVRITDFDWNDTGKFVVSSFLDWCPLSNIHYFILADCLYYEQGIEAIYKFIEWTAANSKPGSKQKFLIAYEERDEKAVMVLDFIHKIKIHPHLRLSAVLPSECGEYASEDLHLLEVGFC